MPLASMNAFLPDSEIQKQVKRSINLSTGIGEIQVQIFICDIFNTMISACVIIVLFHKETQKYLAHNIYVSIGWLQNQCGDVLLFVGNLFLFFLPSSEIHVRGYWNRTKFPIHQVRWLREASQIGQTFILPMWKHLKHSTAEFQSIQQFWLQLDIVSEQKEKENKKYRHAGLRPETREIFFWGGGGGGGGA